MIKMQQVTTQTTWSKGMKKGFGGLIISLDHGGFEPEPRCFTNTGAWSIENMLTLNLCGQEWIFPMVVNLAHESMFSLFWDHDATGKRPFSEPMVSGTVIKAVFGR